MSLHSDTLFLSSFATYHRVCNQINMTGSTSGAGTAYLSGAPEFTPEFQYGSCYSIFSFICMFCRSLFVLLYFFFSPLCCLFFFDIRFLIAPLVSSNSSDSEPNNLCSFSVMLRTQRRSNTYQLYSLWFDPTGVRTHDLPHSRPAR